jgi:hypothetical protein
MKTMTIEIMQNQYSQFCNKVKALNKKADKLGLQKITFNIIETINNKKVDISTQYEEIKYIIDTYIVEIIFENLKINNYEVVAVVEAIDNNKNLIYNISDDESINLEIYRNKNIECEHCNTNRYRKTSIILQNTIDNSIIEVGKSCLKDYTHNTNALLELNFYTALKNINEFDYKENFATCTPVLDIYDFLKCVNNEILKNGFLSKTKAIENGINTCATSEIALKMYGNSEFNNIENYSIIEKALSWIRNLKIENNNYLQNLQVICKNDNFEPKFVGFVASLIPAYQKFLQKQEEKRLKEQSQNNTYFGNIKDKIEIELKLINTYSFASEWGLTNIYKFTNKNNQVFIWKTGNALVYEKNDTIKIKGTIKAHNIYNTEYQTILTRCKIL